MSEHAMRNSTAAASTKPPVAETRVRCIARRRNGTPCRAYADTGHGSPFCVHHEPYCMAFEAEAGPLDGWLIYRDTLHFAWEVIIGHDPRTGQLGLLPPRPQEFWQPHIIAGVYRLAYQGADHVPVWRWTPWLDVVFPTLEALLQDPSLREDRE